MRENTKNAVATIILMVVIAALGFGIGASLLGPHRYKQGQIDAINGIIKYELVVQPNGSMQWEESND